MRMSAAVGLVLSSLSALALPAIAQEPSIPFENRITPSERVPELLEAARAATGRSFKLFASPLLVRSEGVWVDQIAAGVILSTGSADAPHPLKLTGSFSHIDLDGARDRKKFGLGANYRVYGKDGRRVSILGKYSDGPGEVGQHLEAGVYAELPVAGPLILSGTALATRDRSASAGKTVNDQPITPGVILGFAKSSLGFEYTWQDGDDDYTVGYEYDPTDALAISVGAGKGHTFSLNLFATF